MRAPHPWLGHPKLQKKNRLDFLGPIFFLFAWMGALGTIAASQMQLRGALSMTRRSKISTRVRRGIPLTIQGLHADPTVVAGATGGYRGRAQAFKCTQGFMLKELEWLEYDPITGSSNYRIGIATPFGQWSDYSTIPWLSYAVVAPGAVNYRTPTRVALSSPVALVAGQEYMIVIVRENVSDKTAPSDTGGAAWSGASVVDPTVNTNTIWEPTGDPTFSGGGTNARFRVNLWGYASVFTYTGAAQTIVVPAGMNSAIVDLYGAEGGKGDAGPSGALGGRVQATIPVTPGETLQINVGQQGVAQSNATTFGGGGAGGVGGTPHAGSGGGATDIRRGGTALANRVAVAGGGGGNMNNSVTVTGGAGGGLTGATGLGSGGVATRAGAGGSQSSGGAGGTGGAYGTGGAGSLGQGGSAVGNSYQGGGGGGGYYGGGGGTGDTDSIRGGGGGGSSYADPTAASVTNTQGAHAGNGLAVLTFSPILMAVYDSFTAADGTNLDDHNAETGQNWAIPSGSWDINGNKARGVSGVPVAVIESGIADAKIQTTVNLPMNLPMGLVFRYVDINNFWYVYFNPSSGTPNPYALRKVVAGSDSQVAISAVNPTLNGNVTQRVEVLGSSVKLYLDDVLTLSVTDSSHSTATKHGLRLSTGAPSGTVQADWFRVDSL